MKSLIRRPLQLDVIKDRLRRYKKTLVHLRMIDTSRLHELSERQVIRRIFQTLDVNGTLDVGSNEGMFAKHVLQASDKDALVVCVEPNESVIEPFRSAHLKQENVVVLTSAVSVKDGAQNFYVTANNEFSSLKKPETIVDALNKKMRIDRTIEVDTISLDTLINRYFGEDGVPNILIKLDTQGMDYEILFASKLVKNRACCVISEIEFSSLYRSKQTWIEHIEMMGEKGFKLSALYMSNSGHFPDLHDMNAVFVNRDAPHRGRLS
ncbi:FkbM family methyltransferase [Mesorhizobium sp. 10J20-29]